MSPWTEICFRCGIVITDRQPVHMLRANISFSAICLSPCKLESQTLVWLSPLVNPKFCDRSGNNFRYMVLNSSGTYLSG